MMKLFFLSFAALLAVASQTTPVTALSSPAISKYTTRSAQSMEEDFELTRRVIKFQEDVELTRDVIADFIRKEMNTEGEPTATAATVDP